MTIKEIRNKIKSLADMHAQADKAHLSVMHEIGKLIDEVQRARGYANRLSAEEEVSAMLKGYGNMRGGIRYVRACWQFAFKLNDTLRALCFKYQLGIQDTISLCNMSMERIDEVFAMIKDGKLKMDYGNNGIHTYHLRIIENPARAGKRRKFQDVERHTGDVSPDYLTAKVLSRGELDEDALVDLLTSALTRFGDKAIMAWQTALVRSGRSDAVRVA